jgi:hypothetical protein
MTSPDPTQHEGQDGEQVPPELDLGWPNCAM